MEANLTIQIDAELEELVPNYLQNLKKNIITIYEGLEKNDIEICRFLGHNIKGSGGSYGFDHISVLGGEIEEAASLGQNKEVKKITLRLDEYLEKIKVTYIAS